MRSRSENWSEQLSSSSFIVGNIQAQQLAPGYPDFATNCAVLAHHRLPGIDLSRKYLLTFSDQLVIKINHVHRRRLITLLRNRYGQSAGERILGAAAECHVAGGLVTAGVQDYFAVPDFSVGHAILAGIFNHVTSERSSNSG